MSMSPTDHFALNRLDGTDKIQRSKFNENFERIDSELYENSILISANAPTASTAGSAGQFCLVGSGVDRILYQCVNVNGGVYTWVTPFKIGDTQRTMRSSLGDKWALCNGSMIDPEQYPDLYEIVPSRDPDIMLSFWEQEENNFGGQIEAVGSYYVRLSGSDVFFADTVDAVSYATKTAPLGVGVTLDSIEYLNGYYVAVGHAAEAYNGRVYMGRCATINGTYTVKNATTGYTISQTGKILYGTINGVNYYLALGWASPYTNVGYLIRITDAFSTLVAEETGLGSGGYCICNGLLYFNGYSGGDYITRSWRPSEFIQRELGYLVRMVYGLGSDSGEYCVVGTQASWLYSTASNFLARTQLILKGTYTKCVYAHGLWILYGSTAGMIAYSDNPANGFTELQTTLASTAGSLSFSKTYDKFLLSVSNIINYTSDLDTRRLPTYESTSITDKLKEFIKVL